MRFQYSFKNDEAQQCITIFKTLRQGVTMPMSQQVRVTHISWLALDMANFARVIGAVENACIGSLKSTGADAGNNAQAFPFV